MAERKLEIVLSGDAKSALSAFAATEKGAQGLLGKVEQVGGKMASAGKKMTIGLTLPIVAGFGFAANAASDLNESVNVTGITFGRARPKIDAFVKTTAKGLGQSERAARDATAQFGGLLQNLGLSADAAANWSIDLTTLASDLGSAFNTDPADAVAAIGSAIRGETEPIRRYNVMLDDASVRAKAVEMGLAATTAEVDKNGKAQASLALIMEQTSKYQGDFANTSDGVANKQRILRARLEDTAASIGGKLLPAADSLLGMAEGLLDGFSGLSDEAQTLGVMVLGTVAALGPLTFVAGKATQATVALAKATMFLATTQSAVKLSALGLGAAITGGIVLYGSYRSILAAVNEDQRHFDERNGSLVNSQALVNAGVRQSTSALRDQAVELFMGAKGSLAADDAAAALAETQRVLAPQIQEATRTLKEMSAASGVSEERIAQLANEMGVNLGAMSEEAREKLAGAVAEVGRAVTPTERLEGVTETLGNEFATAAEEIDAFKEALDAALGVHLTAEEASIRLREKTRDLAAELAEGAKEGESHAAMQDRLALSMIGVVEQAQTEVEALTRAGKISTDTKAQTDALRGILVRLRDEFPGLRKQIDSYIGRLDAIPEGEATEITTPGLPQSQFNIGNWQRLLERTPPRKPTEISTPGVHAASGRVIGWQELLGRTPRKWHTRLTGDTSDAERKFSDFVRKWSGANLSWTTRLRAGAMGDGPGGPVPGRGGRALARVQSIIGAYPGLRITSTYRSPARNRAVGGSPTSYHLDRNNPAVDIGGPTWQLDRIAAAFRAAGGWRELLWRTKGHYDHVHVAHAGGVVAPSWPTMPGLASDERPAVLQVGETVVPRGTGAGNWSEVSRQASRMGEDMLEALIGGVEAGSRGLPSTFAGVGTDVTTGLALGLRSGEGTVWSAMSMFSQGMPTKVKDQLGIGSPSSVFHGYGHSVGTGYANGINAAIPQVTAAYAAMMRASGMAQAEDGSWVPRTYWDKRNAARAAHRHPAPRRVIHEDQPGWNWRTMGNRMRGIQDRRGYWYHQHADGRITNTHPRNRGAPLPPRLHTGGMVSPSWPTLEGLRGDERPAILQVGEQVVPKGKAGGGDTHIHYHIGTFVGSDERAFVELAQRAKRKGYVGV